MTTTIWHNPRCSKSRQTLALLEAQGVDVTIKLYLEDTPTPAALSTVLDQLGIPAWDWLRRGEAVFKTLGLSKDSGDQAILEAMHAHPVLIERPVVIHGKRAALGRPPENVLALFD